MPQGGGEGGFHILQDINAVVPSCSVHDGPFRTVEITVEVKVRNLHLSNMRVFFHSIIFVHTWLGLIPNSIAFFRALAKSAINISP